jgi:hypothetical protein
MLPNFLHIGVAKAASTWLWHIYQEHPDICVPTRKVRDYSGCMTVPDNCNFFVADFYRGLDWYEQTYFSAWDGEHAVGELSNSYMVDELALQRIAESLPEVKLTMTVRNPIEVTWLQYLMQKQVGCWAPGTTPFETVLDIHSWQRFRMWVEPGYYHQHLTRVLRYFPRERVQVLVYDDLVSDPRAFAETVFSFLGVEPRVDLPSIDRIIGFPRPEKPDTPEGDLERGMPPDLRERLRQIFADQNARLGELLDRDLSHWV